MAWTLKDLRNFIEETAEYDENEIVYITGGSYFATLGDGDIILESDLED